MKLAFTNCLSSKSYCTHLISGCCMRVMWQPSNPLTWSVSITSSESAGMTLFGTLMLPCILICHQSPTSLWGVWNSDSVYHIWTCCTDDTAIREAAILLIPPGSTNPVIPLPHGYISFFAVIIPHYKSLASSCQPRSLKSSATVEADFMLMAMTNMQY